MSEVKQQEWVSFFIKRRSLEDINLFFTDDFYLNYVKSNPSDFFKYYIVPVINKGVGKKWIDNGKEIKEMLGFFINNTKDYFIEEEVFNEWCSFITQPKYDFLAALFFNNINSFMSLNNIFNCINYESFNNISLLKRICKNLIGATENDYIFFEKINEETLRMQDGNKKDILIKSFFTSKNKLVQNFCQKKYWLNFTESQKIEVTEDLIKRKGLELELNFYSNEIKSIFQRNIKNTNYFDLLGGSLNKNKVYLYVQLLNEIKNESNKVFVNKALYKLIDKSLFNKSENIYNFMDIKKKSPQLIPSEFMLLAIYRAIHVLKKEVANNLINDIFLLARDINEEKWLQNEMYDFQKTHDLGTKVNFGKHERVKKVIIEHMYNSLSYTMNNENKTTKKLKI